MIQITGDCIIFICHFRTNVSVTFQCEPWVTVTQDVLLLVSKVSKNIQNTEC